MKARKRSTEERTLSKVQSSQGLGQALTSIPSLKQLQTTSKKAKNVLGVVDLKQMAKERQQNPYTKVHSFGIGMEELETLQTAIA